MERKESHQRAESPERSGGMARSVAVVGGATLLSRVLGLVRDIVLAGVLGASMPADAFFAAFRLPNFLRRMFAEGSLTHAFIPVFTEVQTLYGQREANRLGSITLNWLLLILTAVSLAGVFLAPQIIALLTPGWVDDPRKFALTVTLTRIMFPYILLVSLVALAMGMLNARGHFAMPSVAPVLLNVALILSALWAAGTMNQPTIGMAVGVLVGGIAQVAIQAPPLWRKGYRYEWGFSPENPHLQKVGRLFLPSVLGSAVYQVNMVVITVLASLLPHGSLSYLYYADRLVQFPLGVFAIAVGTVVLPAMSRHAANGDLDALRETVSYAFRQISLIMVPAALSLIVLAEPIMSVLFQRGRFGPLDTKMSAEALVNYSIGLWFIAQIRIVAPAFYALKDTLTPMKVATLSIGVNLLLSIWLMGPLGHAGLALAVSLSSIFQLGVLLWKLNPRLEGFDRRGALRAFPKVMAATGGTGLLCWVITAQIDWLTAPFGRRAAVLAIAVVAGGLFYGTALYILRVREMKDLMAAFLVRLRGDES